mmetsp:Transcript_36501/g.94825  ORF Transcript_36501/g.94825 Transcript_36501/m.94825 type:complete len:613 (+) Transcript_36501:4192-6030(+)
MFAGGNALETVIYLDAMFQQNVKGVSVFDDDALEVNLTETVSERGLALKRAIDNSFYEGYSNVLNLVSGSLRSYLSTLNESEASVEVRRLKVFVNQEDESLFYRQVESLDLISFLRQISISMIAMNSVDTDTQVLNMPYEWYFLMDNWLVFSVRIMRLIDGLEKYVEDRFLLVNVVSILFTGVSIFSTSILIILFFTVFYQRMQRDRLLLQQIFFKIPKKDVVTVLKRLLSFLDGPEKSLEKNLVDCCSESVSENMSSSGQSDVTVRKVGLPNVEKGASKLDSRDKEAMLNDEAFVQKLMTFRGKQRYKYVFPSFIWTAIQCLLLLLLVFAGTGVKMASEERHLSSKFLLCSSRLRGESALVLSMLRAPYLNVTDFGVSVMSTSLRAEPTIDMRDDSALKLKSQFAAIFKKSIIEAQVAFNMVLHLHRLSEQNPFLILSDVAAGEIFIGDSCDFEEECDVPESGMMSVGSLYTRGGAVASTFFHEDAYLILQFLGYNVSEKELDAAASREIIWGSSVASSIVLKDFLLQRYELVQSAAVNVKQLNFLFFSLFEAVIFSFFVFAVLPMERKLKREIARATKMMAQVPTKTKTSSLVTTVLALKMKSYKKNKET